MLQHLYGKDTRSVRVLNLGISIMWCYLIITNISGYLKVNLPEKIEPSFNLLLTLLILNLVLTCFTFVESNYRVKLKYVSLTLGSLIQALIGLKFANNYPPFDIMVIVCFLLSMWFVGGAIYIKQLVDKEIANASMDNRDIR